MCSSATTSCWTSAFPLPGTSWGALPRAGGLRAAAGSAWGGGTAGGGGAGGPAAGLPGRAGVGAEDMADPPGGARLWLRWEAIGPDGAVYPALDAVLTLTPAGE